MEGSNNNSETTKIIVLAVGGLLVVSLAYWGIIKPILNKAGVTRDKEERKGDQDQDKLTRKQVLSPQLYRDNRDKITISSQKAYENARAVYKGRWGGCWGTCDDEDMAIGSITSAGSKVNISYVGDAFQELYGKSMGTYMDYLEPEDWTEIDNYINKIKKF